MSDGNNGKPPPLPPDVFKNGGGAKAISKHIFMRGVAMVMLTKATSRSVPVSILPY